MKRVNNILLILVLLAACQENTPTIESSEWVRHPNNPVFQDEIANEPYEVASDPHVFYDQAGQLWMMYSGDADESPGSSSIKLAKGNSWSDWEEASSLLYEPGPSGLDINKETAFYYRTDEGKHQIYYIGYPDDNYESQVYLAESDRLEGPYEQYADPVVSLGTIANREIEVITSPSVVEHDGLLYLFFLGWDNLQNPTAVWVIGATSEDDGHTWSNFQEVGVPIGMEGQVTKTPEGKFCAVRTGEYEDKEAIFYATADHPLGPWKELDTPLITKQGDLWETDEIIAPQITFSPENGLPVLYYTGADHQKGWWVMLATETGWVE